MLPAAYRRSGSNPSPRGAMMRRVPPRGESVTTRIDRRLRHAPPADSEVYKPLAADAFSGELKAKRPRSFRKGPPMAGEGFGRAQRNQHNQASRNAARERAAKVFVERSVAAAPNPVTADELAAMKKELEQAGSDLVVPRANEEAEEE